MMSLSIKTTDLKSLDAQSRRYWQRATPTAKRTIQQYMDAGYEPKHVITTDIDCTVQMQKFSWCEMRGQRHCWTHPLEITVLNNGKIKSSNLFPYWEKAQYWTEAIAAPEPTTTEPEEKPKRKRKPPALKPGDLCTIPSGDRVYIDAKLDEDRYAVTWECGGMQDIFPRWMLTKVLKRRKSA